MVAQVLGQTESLQLPIQFKKLTDGQIREYHLKKLYELSLGALGEILQLEEPTYEQKCWIVRKLKAYRSSWNTVFIITHAFSDGMTLY